MFHKGHRFISIICIVIYGLVIPFIAVYALMISNVNRNEFDITQKMLHESIQNSLDIVKGNQELVDMNEEVISALIREKIK